MSFEHELFQMNPCFYGTQLSGCMLKIAIFVSDKS